MKNLFVALLAAVLTLGLAGAAKACDNGVAVATSNYACGSSAVSVANTNYAQNQTVLAVNHGYNNTTVSVAHPVFNQVKVVKVQQVQTYVPTVQVNKVVQQKVIQVQQVQNYHQAPQVNLVLKQQVLAQQKQAVREKTKVKVKTRGAATVNVQAGY